MKRFFTTTILALALVVVAVPSKAQVAIDLGPRIGYDLGGDTDALFIGAGAVFGIPDFPIDIGVAFDYYFVGDDTFGGGGFGSVDVSSSMFQLSVNALYDFVLEDMDFVPYAGAGLGISRISTSVSGGGVSMSDSSSDTGINLIGGARFDMGNVYPFAQAQFTIGDLDLFTLAAGVLIPIGR